MTIQRIDIRAEIKAMTWPELIRTHKAYDHLIYGENPCFGTRDLIYMEALEEEIDRRQEQADDSVMKPRR